MKDMMDTVAAISTAFGEGGIGIIRISGPGAAQILQQLFVRGGGRRAGGQPLQAMRHARVAEDGDIGPGAAESAKRGGGPDAGMKIGAETATEKAGPVQELPDRHLSFGRIVDPQTGEVVDEVLAVRMGAPRTYTGEDVAEIHCHGSVVALRRILSLVYRCGARPAEPGEFTQRAFLNGRMDLSQAEAVIDVIQAKTDRSFDVAVSQMEGSLSARISRIRAALTDVLVDITVNIDYPDEDIEELTCEMLSERLRRIRDDVDRLLATGNSGRIVRDGLHVVIAGRPNVGKSSLLNALLRESRAIVTDIPGTTRDMIEEVISVRGIPVRLTDTAGIRQAEDLLEQMGIDRSRDALNRADLIILTLDGSEPLKTEDLDIINNIENRRVIALINKTDLPRRLDPAKLKERLPGAVMIEASILEGRGLDQLEEEIEKLVYTGQAVQKDSLLVTGVRHLDLLRRARAELSQAVEMAEQHGALEFIEVDVHGAFELLGEITGETVREDILDEVFSRFCLGK